MMANEAILRVAMEAGCDEAERFGYGSALGYAEAASISEKAAAVALERSTEAEREWCRGILDADRRDGGDGRIWATLANMASVRLRELGEPS